ncbi:MAG: hypothetical protein ACTS3F_09230 [Phycisphaerales bacterium]
MRGSFLMMILMLVVVPLLMLVPAVAGDGPFVDPYSVRSASGEWVLRVVPSEAEGGGSGHYTMRRGGEVVWEGEREHTLRECVVSDGGMVVGYAYDNGYMGWDGNLVVLSIGADGRAIATDAHERRVYGLSNPPSPGYPMGRGVMIDEATGRAIVRLEQEERWARRSHWLVYGLADGRLLEEHHPEPPLRVDSGFGIQLNAWTIPDTGLAILHWIVFEGDAPMAVFEVLDRDGVSVWVRRIEDEYADRPDGWRWVDLRLGRVRQVVVGAASFAIVSYAEGQRRRYTAAADGPAGGYAIREVGSEAGVPAGDRGALVQVDPLPGRLEHLGDVTLGTPADDGVIEGIYAISFDDRGRIGWIRSGVGSPDDERLCLVDREGNTVGVYRLGLPEATRSGPTSAVWLNDDRWLVARSVRDADNTVRGEAWFFDVGDGRLTPIEGLEAGLIRNIARRPGGGFVVLAHHDGGSLLSGKLVLVFDAEGRKIHATSGDHWADDVTALWDGSVACISTSGFVAIQSSRSEASTDRWSVPEKMEHHGPHERAYCTMIRADRDGGVLVVDSGEWIYRFDREGTLLRTIRPLGPGGERFYVRVVGVDPDGWVWASDGSRLYRYDEEGRADRWLGGPAEGTMAQPEEVTIGDDGRIYAVERGTASVHVFDEHGQPVRVMKPDPGDTVTQVDQAWIAAYPGGVVRLCIGAMGVGFRNSIISFDAAGDAIAAREPYDAAMFSGDNRRDIGRGWSHDGVSVRRTDGQGRVIVSTRHRPDGGWIARVHRTALGPDSSLAVMCIRDDPHAMLAGSEPAAICLFGPDGEGRGTIELKRGTRTGGVLAFDGQRVALTDRRGLTVFQTPLDPKSPARRYDIKGPDDAYWTVIPRREGIVSTWRHGSRVVNHWRMVE